MGAVTAKAAVIEGYGAPDVLVPGAVEVPDPGPTQVRVAVRYAGVGPTDLEIRAGHLAAVFPSPPGTALGFEVAGTVEAAGTDVRDVSVGDDVAAFLPGLGGYASLCLADHWVPTPAHVDPADAAALAASGEAAVRVLSQLAVAPGETLLLLGGTGSVGLVALQLAVRRGAGSLRRSARASVRTSRSSAPFPSPTGPTWSARSVARSAPRSTRSSTPRPAPTSGPPSSWPATSRGSSP